MDEGMYDMDQLSMRTIGWVLIVGFVMLVVGGVAAPSGAYQGEISARRQVIETNRSQWLVSKVFDGLAVLLPAVGFVLLALVQSRQGGSNLNTVAGIAGGLGGVVGVLYVLRLATDPLPLYDRASPVPIALLLYGLFAMALILFGVTFLRSTTPNWLALLMMVVPGLVLIFVILISGANPVVQVGPEAGFGIGVLLYLVVLVLGIVLTRLPTG